MERSLLLPLRNRTLWLSLAAGVLVILNVIAYYPALKGDFTNWDDNHYVSENDNMKGFSLQYALNCFTHFEIGNYHPLTMISLSLNYDATGPDAYPFHLTNLYFHIINTLLLLFLLRKMKINDAAAMITAVLFAVQATRAESVAWISARKELLSAFFFLLSIILYAFYYESGKWKFYFLSLLLFVCALLSKATTVVLAPVLLLMDVWVRGSKLNTRVLLEKLPYFALAVAAGLVAVLAQQGLHAIKETTGPYGLERWVMATANLLIYIQTLVVPYNINAFYPLPLTAARDLQGTYYLYALIFIALAVLTLYISRKSWSSNLYIFGLLYFVVTLVPVLQLIPVGEAARADRYTYLPGIGIFLMMGLGISYILKIIKPLWIPVVLLIPLLLATVMVTRAQSAIWQSSWTLWNSIIERNPRVATAYCIRGQLFEERGDPDKALADYSAAVSLNPEFTAALNNRAILYTWKGKYADAERDLTVALRKSPYFATTYANMGFMMTRSGRYQEALSWLNDALQMNPGDPFALGNRGYCFLEQGDLKKAVDDLDHSLSLKADNPYAWFFRARYSLVMKDTTSCCTALYNARKYGYSHYAGNAADSLFTLYCGNYAQ